MCTKSTSIRYFEKYSGIQIITDTLEDNSKPEPERSEAVALLAQVTAPWLEDNHSVRFLFILQMFESNDSNSRLRVCNYSPKGS